jgi:DNA repair exonuclease SbcCD ATPase subunit
VKDEANLLDMLEQEIEAYRNHIRQAGQVANELADILAAVQLAEHEMEDRLEKAKGLLQESEALFEKARHGWQEIRGEVEAVVRELEAKVLNALEEQQKRLTEFQRLIFERVDGIENQLKQQRVDFERRLEDLEKQASQHAEPFGEPKEIAKDIFQGISQGISGFRSRFEAMRKKRRG